MFSSSPLDWGLIAVYFAFLAAVWLRPPARRSEALEYLVAGRRVTLPAFVRRWWPPGTAASSA
jgi:hypothetical protein